MYIYKRNNLIFFNSITFRSNMKFTQHNIDMKNFTYEIIVIPFSFMLCLIGMKSAKKEEF